MVKGIILPKFLEVKANLALLERLMLGREASSEGGLRGPGPG